jgi:hypothetical protein
MRRLTSGVGAGPTPAETAEAAISKVFELLRKHRAELQPLALRTAFEEYLAALNAEIEAEEATNETTS